MLIITLLAIIMTTSFAIMLFKNRKNSYRIGLFAGIMILLFSIGSFTSSGGISKTESHEVIAAKVTKKRATAKDKYQTAKKENVALIAKEKKLLKQEKKLKKQKKKVKADVKKAEQQQQSTTEQASQESQTTEHQQANTNMGTGDSGQIVGNANTKVYHVSGQKSYRMNSANAVYFNTEQDAINAGYRRSLR